MSVRSIVVVAAAALVAAGCVSQEIHRVNTVAVTQATETLPEEALLDAGIVVFHTGIPDDPTQDAPGAFPRVREAEARFLPYQLKLTMQQSGYWGAVRVLPAPTTSSDLLVYGQIHESDGDLLDLQIRAEDASGRVWLNRRYRQRIPVTAYNSAQDPYQNVFNEIVNDLVQARNALDDEELARVRQIAELRFAAELTPDAFGDYVSRNRRGQYRVQRLPADGDPLMARAMQVRQRDQMFVDTLDGHFGRFYYDIEEPYDGWRRYAREEAAAVRELQSSARWRTGLGALAIAGAIVFDSQSNGRSFTNRVIRDVAIYGGIEAIRSGIGQRREAAFHEAALGEVTGAFQGAVRPVLIDMQGETLRLTGTAEAQYEEWQRLMREMYAAETGFIADVDIYVEEPELRFDDEGNGYSTPELLQIDYVDGDEANGGGATRERDTAGEQLELLELPESMRLREPRSAPAAVGATVDASGARD